MFPRLNQKMMVSIKENPEVQDNNKDLLHRIGMLTRVKAATCLLEKLEQELMPTSR